MKRWAVENPPAGWMRLRNQWEYSHAVRLMLHLTAFGALIGSVLHEIPSEAVREMVNHVKKRPDHKGAAS